MKYTLCIVGLVCLIAGCTGSQTSAPGPGTEVPAVAATTEQYDQLEAQVNRLTRELRELQEYLESDPKFLLRLMDRDLDAIERGEDSRGSFSDYFVPNAAKAFEAGVAKRDVAVRIERVIVLAEKKIYLSGFVAQLIKEGGPEAIRAYADDWIREYQQSR